MSDGAERVRRLLNLAARAGTAAEAETAARLAREEMARTGVTARDVARAEAERRTVSLDVASPDEAWRRQVAFLAARRRGCKVHVVQGWSQRARTTGYRFVGEARDARGAVSDFLRVAVEIDAAAARAATKHVWKIERARVVWFDAFRDRAVAVLTEREFAKKDLDKPAPVDAAPKVKGGDAFGKNVKSFTSGWREYGTPKLSAEEAAAQLIESARERAEKCVTRVSFDTRAVRLLAVRSQDGWADLAEVAEKFKYAALAIGAGWRAIGYRPLAARSHEGWADAAMLLVVAEEHSARTVRRSLVAAQYDEDNS